MRDGAGVLLVAVGLTWTLLTGDKIGLVLAFGGANLLALDVLRPSQRRKADGQEPPIF